MVGMDRLRALAIFVGGPADFMRFWMVWVMVGAGLIRYSLFGELEEADGGFGLCQWLS